MFTSTNIKIKTIKLAMYNFSVLSLPVLADGEVLHPAMVASSAVQVHPLEAVLPAHGETVLVVDVIWLPLVPVAVLERVPVGPLPGPLLEIVHPAQPVAHKGALVSHVGPGRPM